MTKKFLVVIIASPVTKDVNYYMNFKTVVSLYLYDIMAFFFFPILVTFCINYSSFRTCMLVVGCCMLAVQRDPKSHTSSQSHKTIVSLLP